jgi:hypothetical protein
VVGGLLGIFKDIMPYFEPKPAAPFRKHRDHPRSPEGMAQPFADGTTKTGPRPRGRGPGVGP